MRYIIYVALLSMVLITPAFSERPNPSDVLPSLKSEYESISKLPWHIKNLKKYDSLIIKALAFIDESTDSDSAIHAQKIIIDAYGQMAEHDKKAKAQEKYLNMLLKSQGKERVLEEAEAIAKDYYKNEEFLHAADFYNFLAANSNEKKPDYLFLKFRSLENAEVYGSALNGYLNLIEKYPDLDIRKKALYQTGAILEKDGYHNKAVKVYWKVANDFKEDGYYAPHSILNIGRIFFYTYDGRQYQDARPFYEYLRDHYPQYGKESSLMLHKINSIRNSRTERMTNAKIT